MDQDLGSTPLKPMFDATPDDPFPQERKTGGGGRLRRSVGEKIIQLADEGIKRNDIAKKLKISVATVYRYLAKERNK
ncbi:Helix-turn-helix domain of resolvase [Blastopirellula retiformator]|uniref:Helix-turn-helix domain of resolvase n=2 Tax=Blastopirellula retiformator TaxID=2527970 RepID=A0A5C5VK20_9BACT|nr:Helix-turn-helix domain of resolvase [Blastopirellula retiformator]